MHAFKSLSTIVKNREAFADDINQEIYADKTCRLVSDLCRLLV